jgi:hypothetical protein
LLLFWVAGHEGVARELLDFPDVVVKQDVSYLMAYVTVCPPAVVARVVDGNGAAVRQVEGRGGERVGLDSFEVFEA